MSSVGILIEAIRDKILATDPNNPTIAWAEAKDILGVSKPRLAIDVVKVRSSDYVSQRELKWNVYLKINGFLKKIKEDGAPNAWTMEDKIVITDYMLDTIARIMSLHDDKNITFICPGFTQFGGEVEAFTDLELAPGLMSFIIGMTAEIILRDTQT